MFRSLALRHKCDRAPQSRIKSKALALRGEVLTTEYRLGSFREVPELSIIFATTINKAKYSFLK